MLDFTVQQFPLRFGLAEGVEPHQAPPGTLTTAENCVWKKTGKVEKRFGTLYIAPTVIGGGSMNQAVRLFTRGTELCVVDGSNLYAYQPTLSAWRNVGPVPTVMLDWATCLDATTGVSAVDQAISSTGISVVAWVVGEPTAAYGTTGAVRFLVRGPNGETLVPPTTANAGTNHLVRTLIIGTTAYIFFQNTTSIVSTTVDLTTMTVTTHGACVTNVKVQGWDACVIGSTIVFAYEDTGGGLKLKSVDTSLAGLTTGSIAGEAGNTINCISIDGASGESLYVGYYVDSTGLIRGACADAGTLVQSVAPVTLENISAAPARTCTKVGTSRYSSTNAVIAWSPQDNASTSGARTSAAFFTNAGAVTACGRTIGVNLITAPFMLGGRCYAMAIDRPRNGGPITTAGLHTVLLRLDSVTGATTPHTYVGKVDVLVGGLTIAGAVARGAILGTTAYFPVPFISASNGSAAPYRTGVRLARAMTPTDDFYRSTSYGSETYFAGGPLSAYDGQRVFDYGFEREPYISTFTNIAGAIVNGTYLYALVREWRSAAGMLYRSSVSIPITKAIAAGPQGLSWSVLPGPVSAKQDGTTLFGSGSSSPIINAIYRTTVGGSTLQRLTVDPTLNTSIADSSAFVDAASDARADADVGNGIALGVRPAVYTSGGIQDDYQPVSGITLFQHADRLWSLAGDRRSWWYSKAFSDDLGTAPGFHPGFRITFRDAQVGGATMDDKAIFFSATGLQYLAGIGPTPNGLNSDFQGPFVIQSDVGCTNARSIVDVPDGVMFLSDRGIYLLTRGLELVWVGKPIKDTLAAFPNITSAVLVAKQNQVRFTCNDVGGLFGRVLVYDYVEKQWSTFRYNIVGFTDIAIADACMWNGAYAIVPAAGLPPYLLVEDPTTNLDDGAYWVQMRLELAPVNASGPLSFQSVREFAMRGVSNTDHDLTIEVAFDDEATYAQTATFPAQSAVTSVGPLEDCSVTIGARRKCSSIRFRITDATPTSGTVGTGQGPSFDMIGLEVGNKRGFGNTPAARKG